MVPVTTKSVAFIVFPDTVPFIDASLSTTKFPAIDKSLSINNLLFILISLVKSTPTFPSIASALIEEAAKDVVPVTTKSWVCNVLLNEASPTTVKSPPMDKSLLTNKRLFILTSKRKLEEPEEVVDTSPTIADAGIEASGTLIVPVTVKSATFAALDIFAVVILAVCIAEEVASTWIPFTIPACKVPVACADPGLPRNTVPSLPILACSVLFVKKPIVFFSVVDDWLTPIYVASLGPINNLLVTSASLDTDKFPFNDKSSETINW